MEAISVTNHCMVPQVLMEHNYETWRSLMEDYLLGQDLWDVVIGPEPDGKTGIETSDSESWKNIIKSWTRNNALALHAIKMSCGPKFLPLVVESKSSKEAWDLLASAANPQPKDEEDEESQQEDDSENIVEERPNENETDYRPLIKAIQGENLIAMEMFIGQHPEALTARVFPGGKTALHYALFRGKKATATWLVERNTPNDLEILDESGYTALARAAEKDYPGVLELLRLMVEKNPRLPNIERYNVIPVCVASGEGNENAARFLYNVTDKSVLSPEYGILGVQLLILCMNNKILDIALDLLRRYPRLLRSNWHGVSPIEVFARTFPLFSREREDQHSRCDTIYEKSNERKQMPDHYRDFLNLVCAEVATFEIRKLKKSVYPAMISATKHGNAKFINEMIRANPDFLYAYDDKGKSMFWHAVEMRNEKIFSLIHKVADIKEFMRLRSNFDGDTRNSVLHLVAMLPHPDVLDRVSSSPVLQLQREVLWFKEVWSLVDHSTKKMPNSDGLTPRRLFSRSHTDMIAAGEKLIKETATSSTVVGALIVTIMFAAAFTVPGGNDQAKGYPIFANKILFKLFIMCDVLSLSSSATSILVFLTILINSYTEEDFLFDLPRRLMIGVLSLFFSIATMMMAFCLALALMLNGRLLLILPIILITSVPVILFSKSMFPLVSKISRSTFGSSIFDRNTKRLTPWDRIALVITSIRKTMNRGLRAKPEDSMV